MSKEAQAKYQREHHDRYLASLRKWREKNPHHSKIYRRTFKGYFVDVYHRMKWRCKSHPRYIGFEVMTRDQWKQFLNDTNAKMVALFCQWAGSGYMQRMSPSIERIDPKKGYIVGNCTWLTQWENSSNGGKVGGRCKNRHFSAAK